MSSATASWYRLLDRARHRDAFEAARQEGARGGFDALRGHKYALLVTFKRNGEAVPTPVWFGLGDDGRAYLRSEADRGKVKRARRDPHVRLAPCSSRGKPLGPNIEGRARVLPTEEEARAEAAIEANYGVGRRLYKRASSRAGATELVYIEIAPAVAGE